MRLSALLLLLSVAPLACDRGPGGNVIEDFRARSVGLACERITPPGELAVTELRATTDTSWAVLDESQRLARGYDDALRPLWSLPLAADGPLGLPTPVSVAVAGDTLAYVVDRARFGFGALDTRTGGGRVTRLDFLPHRVVALAGGGAAVIALPVGPRPERLLFLMEGESARALDVPRRPYPDLTVNGLGNMMAGEADARGGLVLVQQYLAPRAFAVSATGEVRELDPPVPDGTAEKRTYVPVPPVTDETLPYLYVGAAALSVDRRTGEVYLLTQSGHRKDERSERAVMRLGPDLAYRASYLLDPEINAGHMALLARRRALLLADDMDAFYLCPLPSDDAAGAPAE